MRAPSRHGRSAANRPFVVDGREYLVSVSAGQLDEKGNVRLRVTFRAQFGTRSVCLLRGLTNRSEIHDYPTDDKKWRAELISVTPKVVCELIRMAHRSGWDPEASKANFDWLVDRNVVRTASGLARR